MMRRASEWRAARGLRGGAVGCRAGLAALAVIALASACAPVDSAYSKPAAMSAAQAHFGTEDEIKFYEVASGGTLRDSVVIVMSTLGLSTTSEETLVAELERGTRSFRRIAVTGPAPAKTLKVVGAALARMQGRDLSKVRLLVIAPGDQRPQLEEFARRADVRFSFISFSALR